MNIEEAPFDPKKYEARGLRQEEVEEMKAAFDLFDTDHSGEICISELKAAMEGLGYEAKSDTLFNIIVDLDKDANASYDFEAFLELMCDAGDGDDSGTREEIGRVFRLFDVDNKGTISVADISRVAKEIGERMSLAEIHELVRRACANEASAEITEEEFYVVMTKKTFP